MSYRDLLKLTLIPSAANCAKALEMYVFGNDDTFTIEAESWLADYGMPDTYITDPTGMDESDTITIRDALCLGHWEMEDPTVSEIVGETSAWKSDDPPAAPFSERSTHQRCTQALKR